MSSQRSSILKFNRFLFRVLARRCGSSSNPDCFLLSLPQGRIAARTALDVQEEVARQLVAGRITQALLQTVQNIAKVVVPADGNPAHAFPQLAGSHLSEVCDRDA